MADLTVLTDDNSAVKPVHEFIVEFIFDATDRVERYFDEISEVYLFLSRLYGFRLFGAGCVIDYMNDTKNANKDFVDFIKKHIMYNGSDFMFEFSEFNVYKLDSCMMEYHRILFAEEIECDPEICRKLTKYNRFAQGE